MNSARPFGAVALTLALLAAAQAEAATIVAARGPSAGKYPVGRKIEADAQVVLAAGDTVTLLDERGTRILRGPGTFPLAQTGGGTRQSVFQALVRDRTTVRVRTGSVRNGPNGEPPRSPNLWYVDVSRPGTYCIADTANLRLWRPSMTDETTLTVREGRASKAIAFAKGEMVAPWDVAALPVKPGSTYELVGGDGKNLGKLSFKLIGPVPQSPEATATLLIDQGCTEQLDLLATTLQLPES